MLADSLEPYNLDIPNQLIIFFSTEHQKYKENLEELKTQKAINKNENEKLGLPKQINSFWKHWNQLKETCKVLGKELFWFVEESKEKSEVNMVVKTSGRKRKCDIKKNEQDEPEGKISPLNTKSRKWINIWTAA